MIAVDTSSLIGFLSGDPSHETPFLKACLHEKSVYLPPVVLSELLSDPLLPLVIQMRIESLPLLSIRDGYWQRVGKLRAALLKHQRKARMADAQIAQCCIDHHIPLITRDKDFKNFVKYGTLKLAVPLPS